MAKLLDKLREWVFDKGDKKQDGSQGEEVCFTDCTMFGKRAEVINKYLHKGDQLFVEGRLKFDSWQDKDGKRRSKLRVLIENFEFLGGGKSSNADAASQSAASGSGEPGPSDDEVPF